MNKTKYYEGKCEIWVYDPAKSGGSIEVYFEGNVVSFAPRDYSKVKDGDYYCEVEYFLVTEQGPVLKLYKSKGGNSIDLN